MSARAISLRARTLAALMVVALVPASILSVLWYRTAEAGLVQSAKSGLAAAASRAAASIDGYLDAGLDAMRTQAQLPSVRTFLASPSAANRSEAQEVLRILASADAVHATVYALLGVDGRPLLSSDGGVAAVTRITDSTVLAAANSFVPLATDVRFRFDDPTDASFFIAAAVRGVNGKAIGILMAEFKAAALDQLVRSQVRLVGPQAQGVLYDEHFIRLAGTLAPGALYRTNTPLPDSVATRLREQRRLRPDERVDGEERISRRVLELRQSKVDSTVLLEMAQTVGDGPEVRLLAAQALVRHVPWRVSVELPRDVAISPTLNALLRDSVLLAILLTAVLAWTAAAISSRLTRPVLELTATSRRFAAGELDARVQVRSSDEIGQLGAAFNDLADRIGTLVVGLEQRTKELEADIAQRERLELELLQTRKLEAVGKLAGGIAHDFNNLLTVVAQNAELAIDEPDVSAPVREALTDIADAAARGAGLTRQLLTFAKRGSSTPRLLDTRAEILSTQRLLRQVLGSHIKLHLDLGEHALCVFIDATQFEQLLVNLAANARDAMERGGSLRLQLRAEPATTTFPEGCVALEIADSGTGMAPEVAARVFEPFFTTKSESRGTGLGLSTVYGIVTQAGGTIAVTSAPGEGTAFTLRFPLRHGEARPAAQAITGDPQQRNEVILLVEDETAVRHAIARSLRRHGYHVHEAGDGAEGIALGRLHRHRIDLLLIDVVMPESDGFVVASTLGADLPNLRVLMMSGYSTDARAQFAGNAPDHPMLEKPFSLAALATAVAAVLDAPVRR